MYFYVSRKCMCLVYILDVYKQVLLQVRVFHADPHLVLVDMTILVKSDYFIGNCVSSVTSYVKRARDVLQKPTAFWGFS